MTLPSPLLSRLFLLLLTLVSVNAFGQDAAPTEDNTLVEAVSTDSPCGEWFETFPVQGSYDDSKPKAEARLCKEGETNDKVTVRLEARPINGGVNTIPALGYFHLKVEFSGMPKEDGEYPIIPISEFNENGYVSTPFALPKHQEAWGNVLDWDDEKKLFHAKWSSGEEGHVPALIFEMKEVKVR